MHLLVTLQRESTVMNNIPCIITQCCPSHVDTFTTQSFALHVIIILKLAVVIENPIVTHYEHAG